jgi:hypothetical protein
MTRMMRMMETTEKNTPPSVARMGQVENMGIWHFQHKNGLGRFMCGLEIKHGSSAAPSSYDPDECCKTCQRVADAPQV